MKWHALAAERLVLYSQIGLRLVDDFTAGPPKYRVNACLEYRDPVGRWHGVKRDPVVSSDSTISFPALGRSVQAASQPVLRYRVTLQSAFYRPEYLLNADGIEFDIHPYDDSIPPVVVPANPQTVLMMPNTQYAYPGYVRLVSGVVEDNVGNPVANVEVTAGVQERVLTDERGAFSLPLRWPALDASVTLDALDHRTGHSDSLTINLPGDLSQGHLFTIL